MKFRELYDPFSYDQPEMTFTKELSLPLHTEKPPRRNAFPPKEDDLDLSSIWFRVDFCIHFSILHTTI